MANERAPIGFDEAVADKLLAMNSNKKKPSKQAVKASAETSGFTSREKKTTAKTSEQTEQEAVERPKFVRPKRSEQMNFKVTPEIYSMFYACVAQSGQTNIGAMIDEAIILLAEKYNVK